MESGLLCITLRTDFESTFVLRGERPQYRPVSCKLTSAGTGSDAVNDASTTTALRPPCQMIDSIFVPVMPRYSDAPDRKAKSELLERLQDDAVQGTDLSFYALNEGAFCHSLICLHRLHKLVRVIIDKKWASLDLLGELPKPGRLGACMTCDGVGSIAVQTGRDRQCALAFTIARSWPTKSVFFERSPGNPCQSRSLKTCALNRRMYDGARARLLTTERKGVSAGSVTAPGLSVVPAHLPGESCPYTTEY
ncbi:hypothetical protein F443_01806 [Phytophthora nicotianae P1569]|uniref:Uncharacterized protein n=1 Tax=Phytophthora nicotianae P1569 TaxID=1317065 RepID=V9FYP9_PHYNI|nr:hypothetical protein F443_01806 [Phytophthora nicotianae P1569]